jgi:hypothetical protein
VGVYDGYVHAYDITTGDRLWQYYSEDTTETPYGTYPFYYGPMMAGGVIFAGTSEHSPSQPLFRGLKLHAINADTGEGIWSVTGAHNLAAIADGYLLTANGYDNKAAIADGYLLTANGYDNKIYCFGKGPSATTVSAPKTQVMQGESLVIEGTVMDKSAGQPDTPCMSDEDMSAWMEYLHMQKSVPMDAKGVDVSIDVVDANGNFRNIGTATSDMSGVYSLVWKPDISGKYTVIATFAGSESYGSSFAQTNFFVEEAPAPTPPPDPTPAPMTDTYIAGSTIAILAGIAVAIFLILRKK